MKNLLLGVAIGAGLVCLYRKMHHEGYMMGGCCDDLSKMSYKAKRKFKNVFDKGRNEAEYWKDRAEYEVDKGADKLNDMMD